MNTTFITANHADKRCPQCAGPVRYEEHKHSWKRVKFCSKPCADADKRTQGPARFWEKVDKSAGEHGCWLYMGFRKWDGYGWLARSAGDSKVRHMTAHRYAWILTNGEPEKGLSIMHQCDNPPCCNPAHLKLGTHAENMREMRERGRSNGGTNRKPKIWPNRVRPVREAA